MSSAPKQKYQIAKRSLCSDIWHWLISDPWRKLVALVLAFFTWAVLNLNINRTGNHRWGTIDHIPLTFLSPQAPSSGHLTFKVSRPRRCLSRSPSMHGVKSNSRPKTSASKFTP